MDWIMYFIMFILGGIVMFMTICIGYAAKQEEPINKVKFFVTKQSGAYSLRLFLGKPIWNENTSSWLSDRRNVKLLATNFTFEYYNLNPTDFADMKEGEIREVFINLED